MAEWFEDESFWIETYPFMFPEDRFDAADEQVEKALKLTNFQEGAVLDLCCGPGRHTAALAKRGLRVTAVDRTRFLLDKAKQRAASMNLEVEFVSADMIDFVRPDAFDLVLSMFTSFGFFENKDDDLKVLKNIYNNLKAGGTFLIDVIGKELLAGNYHQTISTRLPDDSLLIQRHEIFDDWSRVRNEWVVLKDDRAKTFKFNLTVYSGQELKALLQRAGFSEIKLFGNLDGKDYGSNASRLIAVARKID